MNNSNNEDNGVNETGTASEGFSPGKCPTVRQGGTGRHQASVKMKWTRDLNLAVMECYFLSNPTDENGKPIRSYRKRMYNIWKERSLPIVTKERLCDQARLIRKNEWFTDVELEEISRRLEGNSDNDEGNSDSVEGSNDSVIIGNTSRLLGEIIVQNDERYEAIEVQATSRNVQDEQERCMIDEIVRIMKSGRRCDTRGLKKVNRNILSKWSSKVNRVLVNIKTDNITDTNKLICAVAQYPSKKVGLRAMGCRIQLEG